MGQAKRRRRQQLRTKSGKTSPEGAKSRTPGRRIGLAIAALLVAVAAVSVVVGSPRSERDESGFEVVDDVVYVNNRKCTMSGSTIAEEDLGRFESRVEYDGPIERFRGKTLVFNQCCPKCIEDFPAKWAVERDDIMRAFGLAHSGPASGEPL